MLMKASNLQLKDSLEAIFISLTSQIYTLIYTLKVPLLVIFAVCPVKYHGN